ncbi:glycosyltransferase family 87 protein [Coleofasciculus sp. LEGE 07092]|uniref:glycosyltransferase family 87 protein n=1 Tax=Coleofasciculus sp. LEGE 07092 TaxID=2777969 RepID=UPI0018821298|nr:glycosyltransferase family 87 protein [Coleofasciculus sp. LEGE 07092]
MLSLTYLTQGFYSLTIAENGANDLLARWQEQQYIYRGIYPYAARAGSPDIVPAIGAIKSGGYPPWAFFSGFFFLPPLNWQLTRFYHGILNLISLAILAFFAYRIGCPYGKSKAFFALSASLALTGHKLTLELGQYGIILNALLIGTFWLLKKYKNSWAGLLLGIAMMKPNISGLYFFVLIIRRRTKAILTCSLYLTLTSLAIGLVTQFNPIKMLIRILKDSKYFADKGYSGINIITNLGFDPKMATLLLGFGGVLGITIIFYIWRNHSLLTLFATASVVGRIFVYHRSYDNIMLIFLLLCLIRMTFRHSHQLNILVLTLTITTFCFTRLIWWIFSFHDNVTQRVEFFILFMATASLAYLLVQEKIQIGNPPSPAASCNVKENLRQD